MGRIARYMRQGGYAQRIGGGAPVYVAAVLEYLTAEVKFAYISFKKTKKNKNKIFCFIFLFLVLYFVFLRFFAFFLFELFSFFFFFLLCFFSWYFGIDFWNPNTHTNTGKYISQETNKNSPQIKLKNAENAPKTSQQRKHKKPTTNPKQPKHQNCRQKVKDATEDEIYTTSDITFRLNSIFNMLY